MSLFDKALVTCDYIDRVFINQYYRDTYGGEREGSTKVGLCLELGLCLMEIEQKFPTKSGEALSYIQEISGLDLKYIMNVTILSPPIETDFDNFVSDVMVIFHLYGDRDYINLIVDTFEEAIQHLFEVNTAFVGDDRSEARRIADRYIKLYRDLANQKMDFDEQ